jgi:ARC6-like, IMS domain
VLPGKGLTQLRATEWVRGEGGGCPAHTHTHTHTHTLTPTPCLCRLPLPLLQVVFAGFPDTAGAASGEGGAAAAPSLLAYYDSDAVQDALAEDAERGAGGPADSLAAGLAGLAAVAGVLRSSVRPLVDQLAEAAGSAGSALGAQLSGASGVSSRRSMADRLASELADAQNPVDLDRGSGSPWPLEEDAAGAGAVGSPVGGLVSRIASAGGVLRGTLAARFGAAWPAAAAAGALGAAVLFATLSRRGVGSPLAPPAPHAVTRTAARRGTEAAAPAATRVLSRGDATRLVRRFQAAKSAALGSAFDESQLPAVCTGPALSHFAAASRDWAARGWFRTSKLWKLDVTDVRPAGRSGTRVRIDATLGESVKTWGVDGQAGTAWSNEYGVEYDVSLGADGQWRIQGVTVRGAAPGERSGWLGMFGGSK